jgi:hypothetical protein
VTRLLLFVYALAFGGLVIAGLVGVGHGKVEGWLYLIGAVVVVGLIIQAWRRLAEEVRRRTNNKTLNDPGATK